MHLKTDFDFFPALRDISCTPEMIALKTRNDKRLTIAKRRSDKVWRPLDMTALYLRLMRNFE